MLFKSFSLNLFCKSISAFIEIVAQIDTLYPKRSTVKKRKVKNVFKRLSLSPFSAILRNDSSMFAERTAFRKSKGRRKKSMGINTFNSPRSLRILNTDLFIFASFLKLCFEKFTVFHRKDPVIPFKMFSSVSYVDNCFV